MKHYISSAVKCPCYHREQPLKIHCDGFSESNTIQISFKDNLARNTHRKKYCKDIFGYKKCPLYKVIVSQQEECDE